MEERLSEAEMELLEKKQSQERKCKDRRYAKVEEGREKFAAKGEVTRTAGSGSQTSEREAELLSVEGKDRKKKEIGLSKAHTINLCEQCYNERRQKQGEQPVKAARWRELMEQNTFHRKLWWLLVCSNTCEERGSTSLTKEYGPKQSGRLRKKKGRREHKVIDKKESPFKKELELSSVAVI